MPVMSSVQRRSYRVALEGLVAKQTDAKTISAAVTKLSRLSMGLVPQVLYRYRPPSEYAFEDLENGALTFSHPSVFSDSYDSRPIYDFKLFDDAVSVLNHSDSALRMLCEIDVNAVVSLTATCGFRPLDSGSIEQFCALGEGEQIELLRKAAPELRKRIGNGAVPALQKGCADSHRILCLTQSLFYPRMWKDYAQDYSGFVIAYSADSIRSCDFDRRVDLLPVLYDDLPFDCELQVEWAVARAILDFNVLSDDVFSDIRAIYRKGTEFEWENEYRACLVPREGELSSRHVARSCKPMAIILGNKMTRENLIRCLAAAEKLGIPAYRGLMVRLVDLTRKRRLI